jgi:thymidylate kinase
MTRRNFILRLVRMLKVRRIPYCVSRNYDELFAKTTSDVDLILDCADVPAVIDCCERAALWGGQRLVQQTRFTNHSLVYWNGEEGFVRIDLDTEVRWRVVHVLTAGEVVNLRRRRGDFFIPEPRHETAVILTKALWAGRVSERYTRRLHELSREIMGKANLPDFFHETFGVRENLLDQPMDAALCARLRWAVLLNTLRRPANLRHMAGYAIEDAVRWVKRLWAMPGVFVRIATPHDVRSEEMMITLGSLFPAEKVLVRNGGVAPLRVLQRLFRGGLVLETHPVSGDAELERRIPKLLRFPFKSRAFLFTRRSSGRAHLAHLGSGCMASVSPDEAACDLTSHRVHFVARVLAKLEESKKCRRDGAFIVLAGLDGSGKTTFARNVCSLVTESDRFSGVRYFHWIPSLLGEIEFPFPATAKLGRRKHIASGALHSVLSCLRLFKNVVLANAAHRLRVRPLLRKGFLVIVDRFVYNYWLDPASVKYSGPGRLLDRAAALLPKPDAVVVLRADAATLLARTQELSPEQIAEQLARLDRLPAFAPARIDLDATQPEEQLARDGFAKITALNVPGQSEP